MMTDPSVLDWSGTYGYPSYTGSDFDPQSLATYYTLVSQQQQQQQQQQYLADMASPYGMNPADAGVDPGAAASMPTAADPSFAGTYPGYNVGYNVTSGDAAESGASHNPYMTSSYADMMKAYQDAYGMADDKQETSTNESNKDDESEEAAAENPYVYGYGANYGMPRGATKPAKKGSKGKKDATKSQEQHQAMYDPRWMMMYYPMMYGYPGMQQQAEAASKEGSDAESDKGRSEKKKQAGTQAASGQWPGHFGGYSMPASKPSGKGKRRGKAAKAIPDPPPYWSLYNPYMMGMNYPMMGMPSGEESDSGIEKDKNGAAQDGKHDKKGKSTKKGAGVDWSAYQKWYDQWQKQYASMAAQHQKPGQKGDGGAKAASGRRNKSKKSPAPDGTYNEEAMKNYYEEWMKAYQQQYAAYYSKEAGSNDEDSGKDGKAGEDTESSKGKSSHKGAKSKPTGEGAEQSKAKGKSVKPPMYPPYHSYYGMHDPRTMMMGMNPYANVDKKKTTVEKTKGEATKQSDHDGEEHSKNSAGHSDEGSDSEAAQGEKPVGATHPGHANMYNPMMMPMYYGMMGHQDESDDDDDDDDQSTSKAVTKPEEHEINKTDTAHSTDGSERLQAGEEVITEQAVGFSMSYNMPMDGPGGFASGGGKGPGRGGKFTYPAMQGMGWMSKKQQKKYQEMMDQWYKSYTAHLEDAEDDEDEDDDSRGSEEAGNKIKGIDDSDNDADTEGQGDQESSDGVVSGPKEAEHLPQHPPYPSMMMPDGEMNETMMQRWMAVCICDPPPPTDTNNNANDTNSVSTESTSGDASLGFHMP